MKIKWIFYNLLFAAVYPFLLPGFLARMIRRGGYAARLGDRFALYPKEILARLAPKAPVCPHGVPFAAARDENAPVWIHAVSVGEVQVAGQLMRAWRAVEPTVRFCFSTTSSTGWKIAEREVKAQGEGEGSGDTLIYNPLDFPNFVKSALKTVRPRAIVLTESEIWPNFIRTAKKYGIPLFLINARVSDRSAPRYRMARFFFRDVFGCFTRIFAQSDLDKARLVAAGAPERRVEVTGSFKFDVAHRNEAKEEELRKWILGEGEGVGEGGRRKILLGASTWPGEDKVLLDIYEKLIVDANFCPRQNADATSSSDDAIRRSRLQCDKPILVLAPRHFEKADAVEANVRAAGFACVRRSRGDHLSPSPSSRPPVFLADTTGELMGLFGICDVAFVGKSLCAHGSQNMIEPCLCGKPTVVGPFTENFRPVMSDLLAAEAIVQVPDAAGLEREIRRFVSDDADARALGARAAEAVRRRQGVVPKCVAAMRGFLMNG